MRVLIRIEAGRGEALDLVDLKLEAEDLSADWRERGIQVVIEATEGGRG